METIEAVVLGITLAACAGFRAFLPLLAVSVLVRHLDWPAPPVIDWVASDVGFGLVLTATVVEMLADMVPLVDNALDTVQTAIKPVAALLVTAGVLHEVSPTAAWVIAIVAGAPLALGVHATKASVRGGSTAATAGLGNPVLSLIENVIAVALAILALVQPLLAALLVLWIGVMVFRMARRVPVRLHRRRQVASGSPPEVGRGSQS